MPTMDVERLRRLPLFGELDHFDLSRLASWMHEVHLREGDVLVEQDDLPRSLVVVEEGSLEVLRDGDRLAVLGPGDVVGEMGLLKQRRAMATVRATEPVRGVALGPERLQTLTDEMPELAERLRATIEERDRANEAGDG
jgi:CRP-like cAMP-binding protein